MSAPAPRPPLHTRGRLLVKELGAFGVVGAVSFLIDVGLFHVFYANAGLGAVTAKLLATAVAMTVAFAGHRYWSFSHRARTGLRGEYLRFSVINGGTLLLGVLTIAVVRHPLQQESALVLQAANIGSIVVGTVIRYLGYRAWVFPAGDDVPAVPRTGEPVSAGGDPPGVRPAPPSMTS
ncbi:GtrA family protein [Blastococcus haudaquaticus]|uniref:Flippase GtrA (Transmembrane translocase of bactoprenol-linked glucose) n=1 Tax=Blastococcus haudaquaticus TaxID=1938745 RepID=A0A286GE34_9ACTN|nr:GtrA family protein [Blastococcus haudaquaticus]SOD93785.1 Putative flippase GtrA (transmembrane translocase of bactoprenol-linked glucose) [Blastococcus haudaquaticus]